ALLKALLKPLLNAFLEPFGFAAIHPFLSQRHSECLHEMGFGHGHPLLEFIFGHCVDPDDVNQYLPGQGVFIG
ncbi:hypothetical protein CKO35_17805, partial [Ectothiorhodospira shaposhnikovii]|nr:hypothetical protein [Ectothiorhodospira shaposhnikovii]